MKLPLNPLLSFSASLVASGNTGLAAVRVSPFTSILVTVTLSVSLPVLRAKKKWSLETALTKGTLTGLVAASAALSAMLSFTLMFVMTREIGKPVVGTLVASGLPSVFLIPKF